MVIGVDIDGVLAELNKYTWHYFRKFLKEENIPYKFDKTKEYFYIQMNVSLEVENEFWERNVFHYAKHGKMMNNADKYMRKLHNDGHRVVIITSRRYSDFQDERGENMRKAVVQWLAKNHIYYDKICFSNEKTGKKALVINEKVDIMIDDSPRNINEISNVVPVLVFKNPANRICKGDNKRLVNSWKDIYKTITNISKNTKNQ